MAQKNKRRESDVMKLMMSEFKLELVDDKIDEFFIWFSGPKDSPYEGGVWKIHVELPDQYPYKSPSIGFVDRIYHPNVDETAGSVCLDVINQTWSPMFDLINVFEVFLPQLLLYPNPTDPLNGEAAALLMREPDAYKKKVKEYVRKYAQKKQNAQSEDPNSDTNSSKSGDEQDNTEPMEIQGQQTDSQPLPTPNDLPQQQTQSQEEIAQQDQGENNSINDKQSTEQITEMNIDPDTQQQGDDEDVQSEGSFLSNASEDDDDDINI
eukprot:TRINITY_DN5384_c1_g2_i1.p2 TRINITY_DN5384_c1_g2~~TRINITY_DN5384_c1_g2_i1.p2  ORF type:complete len:265 (+),score=50.11 TRINITY_DN5384_c1_g2_i1:327-1121(+)